MFDFQNFGEIVFEPPLSIRDLATAALQCKQSGWTPEDGPIEDLVESVSTILTSKSEMLKKYYNLVIEDDKLMSLPLLIGMQI